jgi:hypothetical protein
MKPSSLMLAAACIALLVVTGHAQEQERQRGFTANEVMKGCRASVAGPTSGDATISYWRGVCVGTVHSLTMMAEALTLAGASKFPVCPPRRQGQTDWTIGQSVRVVAKYIDDRPNRLHESFSKLAIEALAEAWPCKG